MIKFEVDTFINIIFVITIYFQNFSIFSSITNKTNSLKQNNPTTNIFGDDVTNEKLITSDIVKSSADSTQASTTINLSNNYFQAKDLPLRWSADPSILDNTAYETLVKKHLQDRNNINYILQRNLNGVGKG